MRSFRRVDSFKPREVFEHFEAESDAQKSLIGDRLRTLVRMGVLEKHGRSRGTTYSYVRRVADSGAKANGSVPDPLLGRQRGPAAPVPGTGRRNVTSVPR